VCIVVVVLCVLLSSYVYFLYYVCNAVFTLDAGQLARSQYSEGPATGHLDTGFSWFPCVYKQMLRWFPRFQVATTCFSYSPPDLNLSVTNFLFWVHVIQPLPPGDNPIAVNNNNNNNYYYYYYYFKETNKAHTFIRERSPKCLFACLETCLANKSVLLGSIVNVYLIKIHGNVQSCKPNKTCSAFCESRRINALFTRAQN